MPAYRVEFVMSVGCSGAADVIRVGVMRMLAEKEMQARTLQSVRVVEISETIEEDAR